ncbi:MAG: RNase adapter RapZ [bacterium]|nr:RNase adapter RapZ [bacterium]
MKVLIQSFSFLRTGYPEDKTGKGGGFVFDCRAIDAFDYSLRDNPDAPFPHMHLTGLDAEIADVLDKDSDTQEFFQAAWTMVRLDIEKCLKRGFKIMTVNFGCTAGQHRSVYMAEHLAKRIRNNLIEVELVHLEQPYWPTKS